jgi:hypothetical protein
MYEPPTSWVPRVGRGRSPYTQSSEWDNENMSPEKIWGYPKWVDGKRIDGPTKADWFTLLPLPGFTPEWLYRMWMDLGK